MDTARQECCAAADWRARTMGNRSLLLPASAIIMRIGPAILAIFTVDKYSMTFAADKYLMTFAALLVLTALLQSAAGQDMPCYTSWKYSKLSGRCYLPQLESMSQDKAASKCAGVLKEANPSFVETKPQLVVVKTSDDALALATAMMEISNNAPYWMDARMDTGSWLTSTNMALNTTLLEQLSPGFSTSGTGRCLTFQYVYGSGDGAGNAGGFQMQYVALRKECTELGFFLCQHDAVVCDPVRLQTADSSIELIPPSTGVFNYDYVACQPGFYRPSELPNAVSVPPPGPIRKNHVYCTGTAHPSLNPALYQARWNSSLVENCVGVSCGVFVGPLYNVQSQIPVSQTNSQPSFKFGYSFNVSCARGYVSYTDPNATTSTVQCQQSDRDRSQGIWAPISNSPCVGVRCNASALTAMIPRNAVIQSARNKITQQQYDVQLQTSFLSLFNNIITIQCLDGFFFPDRQWNKQLICDLDNNSLVTGVWQGYLGTSLPLYSSCQNSTCTYESILITPAHNLQPFFMMMNSIGVYINQTQPTGEPYPYQSQLMFFCNDGCSTGTASAVQNLVCGPQGKWIPNLTPCISIIPPLKTGLAQHYVPPAVEAPAAQEIGYVAIVILVVFLSLIVILDLSTLARDIKLMRNNIRNLHASRKNKTSDSDQ